MSHPDTAKWPDGVTRISISDLGLLGVHKNTGRLYWDGKEVVTRSVISLRPAELVIAAAASLATVGMFVLEAGRTVGWWC